MSEEEKSEDKKKRTISQYNQWLRIIMRCSSFSPQTTTTVSRGSGSHQTTNTFLPDHIYHLVFNKNRAPSRAVPQQEDKPVQTGTQKDTQASLQQLSKLQVPQGVGGSHQTETTPQELERPERVCLYLEYKYLEHYTEETCSVPEWFGSEARAKEWDNYFLIRMAMTS